MLQPKPKPLPKKCGADQCLKPREPGRPRIKRCRVSQSESPSEAEDVVAVEREYENKLLSYYSDLYLNECNSVMEASKARKLRSTYSNAVRFEVLEYLGTGESVRATARAFGIPKSTIKKTGYPEDKSKQKGVHNKAGAGRPLNYPKFVDEELLAWILNMRDLQIPISCTDIQIKGKELITPHNLKFVASDGWLEKFMNRNKLVLRAMTSLARLPAQLKEKIANFYIDVQRVRQKESYPFCFIGNMDETPAYFDLVPSKVVSRKGAKDCHVITTGSEKSHVTVVLTVTADGHMPPPMVIFK